MLSGASLSNGCVLSLRVVLPFTLVESWPVCIGWTKGGDFCRKPLLICASLPRHDGSCGGWSLAGNPLSCRAKKKNALLCQVGRALGYIGSHNIHQKFTRKRLNWVQEPLNGPVYGGNDQGDCGEAQSCCRPLSDGQRPLGASTQQVERRRTHAVNGEARDDHRGQRLPHKRVHHCKRYPPSLSWIVPVSL